MSSVSEKVGSTKVFENDKIIVWDFQLEPGEETAIHTHKNSYMWYAVKGGDLDCEDADGNDLGIFEVPDKGIFNLKLEGDELEVMSEIAKGVKFPATHKAKNISDETYHEIIIEFKK